MMSWSQAFRKLAWIPILLILLHIGGFTYDAIHSGISKELIFIYLTNFILQFLFFYVAIVVYFRYALRAAFFILTVIFALFGLCSVKDNPMTDALRTFIETHMNLEFFVGFLTVAALLITLAQIQGAQQEKYKVGLYFPPQNKDSDKSVGTVIISQKKTQEEKNKKHKRK